MPSNRRTALLPAILAIGMGIGGCLTAAGATIPCALASARAPQTLSLLHLLDAYEGGALDQQRVPCRHAANCCLAQARCSQSMGRPPMCVGDGSCFWQPTRLERTLRRLCGVELSGCVRHPKAPLPAVYGRRVFGTSGSLHAGCWACGKSTAYVRRVSSTASPRQQQRPPPPHCCRWMRSLVGR